MTVAPSIDPARFLEEHLAQASPDLLRDMLTTFINTLLSADAVCGASYRTVSDERINRRNGYRHSDFYTCACTIDVAIPKLRQGTYFPDWLLERRRTRPHDHRRDLLPPGRLDEADGETRRDSRHHRPVQVTGLRDVQGAR